MREVVTAAQGATDDKLPRAQAPRSNPSARVVLGRALRTGALTTVIVLALQPATWDLVARIAGAARSLLPVLAVAAAVVLSLLGRALVLADRWPAGFMRALLAIGWLLAGAVVARRTVSTLDVDLAAVVVGALVLPAKLLLRR